MSLETALAAFGGAATPETPKKVNTRDGTGAGLLYATAEQLADDRRICGHGGGAMSTKYEIIEVDKAEITVDVSMLRRGGDPWFNATEMSRAFGRHPAHFLQLDSTKEYIAEVSKEDGGDSQDKISNLDFVRVKHGGKYRGTWLHRELAYEFAGWLSPLFRRRLHKWVETRLEQERVWAQERIAAKTGFAPLTEAIQNSHENPQFYHYANEADLINRIALGMSAKEFKSMNGVEDLRDALSEQQLAVMNQLQHFDTGLVNSGMSFQERKEHLARLHERLATRQLIAV